MKKTKKYFSLMIIVLCLIFVEVASFATTYWPYVPSPTIESRSSWNAASPITSQMDYKGTTNRIIFHHTGWNFSSTNYSDCAAEVKEIQNYHMNTKGWADIAYHYVIDPAGRIWQGRSTSYKGSHTYGYNDDIGVVNLGDFQGIWGIGANQVTTNSFEAMKTISKRLAWLYDLDLPVVYCHADFMSTACPGQNMYYYITDSLAGYMYNSYTAASVSKILS